MTDRLSSSTPTRTPRGPPRPPPPPARLVALAALGIDPRGPAAAVVQFARADPCLGGWMRRIEAERLRDRLQADGLRLGEAERIVSARTGYSVRQLRRLRRGL